MFSCQPRKNWESHQGPLERAWEVSELSIALSPSSPPPCHLTFLVMLQLQIFASLQLPGAVCAVHHPGAPGTCQRVSPYLGECWEFPLRFSFKGEQRLVQSAPPPRPPTETNLTNRSPSTNGEPFSMSLSLEWQEAEGGEKKTKTQHLVKLDTCV